MPKKTPRTSGSVAMDDYLEQILHLIEEKGVGYARPVDVSKKLNISQASVTNMLQRLDAEGFVNHEKYRGTTLTEKGLTIANAIVMRHQMLTKFLRLFGLDEETIYKDVEGMEHHVSKDTLNVITSLIAELEEDPELLKRVKSRI
jgi:Mn-dependent DtxR family transcriptional regulator